MNEVTTGTTPLGLRWAAKDGWRVMAYTEGGYCIQQAVPGVGWCLTSPGEECPAEVEELLCDWLGIFYRI